MLRDEDREWLKELNASLWPSGKYRSPVKLEARRKLTWDEQTQLGEILDRSTLLAEMFSSNMFGGYGVFIYEHELYPGTGPTLLCTVVDENLVEDRPTWHEHLTEKEKPVGHSAKRESGAGSDLAWYFFSKYTHTDQNLRWLREYKMPAPRRRDEYDY